jgi:hypothetical protein
MNMTDSESEQENAPELKRSGLYFQVLAKQASNAGKNAK